MSVAALDLNTIPAGVYRVERRQRVFNLQLEKPEHGRWAGWCFVSELSFYKQPKGVGSQSPGSLYRGPHQDDLRAIRRHPAFFRRRYVAWALGTHALDDRLHDRPVAKL